MSFTRQPWMRAALKDASQVTDEQISFPNDLKITSPAEFLQEGKFNLRCGDFGFLDDTPPPRSKEPFAGNNPLTVAPNGVIFDGGCHSSVKSFLQVLPDKYGRLDNRHAVIKPFKDGFVIVKNGDDDEHNIEGINHQPSISFAVWAVSSAPKANHWRTKRLWNGV
jgi:hypothetical protein